ncbi:GNAT family N-acetyltransferase [Echinicola jeungdonensis]|uniref:Aminoglycoside N(6')-acetyltransferase type 1 n=1 Tax=Echinicola jeungdonensis TaxID=709343 RepID=A0ABV5J267_9BACT|nr:aminoglycoside 6'-N-acetyltransferase [Echinicola jeungdonensis]MDN3669063.1 GNAT family N-acetyltransferase [Echinicola jeungdonensis]
MKRIAYFQFENSDFDQLLKMSQKLWKDFDKAQLENLLKQTTQSEKYNILIAKDPKGKCVGFSIFSIRTDYVEGAEKSPTGYLEGIFVEAEFRKMGMAKEFLRIGEFWCKEKGCTQIGSDTWLNDKESREFHKRVGFWEEEEVVHFLKNLK